MVPYGNPEKQGLTRTSLFARIVVLLAHIAMLFLMVYGMAALQQKNKNIVENIIYCLGYLGIPLNCIFLIYHAFDIWLSFHEPLKQDN